MLREKVGSKDKLYLLQQNTPYMLREKVGSKDKLYLLQ